MHFLFYLGRGGGGEGIRVLVDMNFLGKKRTLASRIAVSDEGGEEDSFVLARRIFLRNGYFRVFVHFLVLLYFRGWCARACVRTCVCV